MGFNEEFENDYNFWGEDNYFINRAFEQDLNQFDYGKENNESETNGMLITEDDSKKNSENNENIIETEKIENDMVIIKTETGKITLDQDNKVNDNAVILNPYFKNDNSENENVIKEISSIDLNEIEIKGFNKLDLKSEQVKCEDNTINSLKRKRGRNGPGETGGEHNKYSDDNLRRKVKHLVLKSVFDFINEKILMKK